jgi:MFS family permease
LTRSQRVAVSVGFLAFGVAAGTVIPRLPALKDHLHLTDGQIGVAFFFFALGAILGAVGSRFVLAGGARLWVRAGLVAVCAATVLPALAPNFPIFVLAFFLIGVCSGFIDALLNAQGAELERLAGRPLINGFHGFWSLGALVGSLVAGGMATLGIAPLPHFAVAGILTAVASAPVVRELPDTRSGAERMTPPGAARFWLTGTVIAVAAITFAGIIVEGGTSDWAAIYLRELSHAAPGMAAAGFSALSFAMMLVRFRADVLTAHTSPKTVVRIGSITAATGLALAIAFPAYPTAIAGFVLVGIGCAVQLPLAFAAGANLGRSGTPLAIVMASAYGGAIVGPLLIGGIAEHFGLRVAMAVPMLASLTVLSLGGSLGAPSRKPAATTLAAGR